MKDPDPVVEKQIDPETDWLEGDPEAFERPNAPLVIDPADRETPP
jgi:hypothetical protein